MFEEDYLKKTKNKQQQQNKNFKKMHRTNKSAGATATSCHHERRFHFLHSFSLVFLLSEYPSSGVEELVFGKMPSISICVGA